MGRRFFGYTDNVQKLCKEILDTSGEIIHNDCTIQKQIRRLSSCRQGTGESAMAIQLIELPNQKGNLPLRLAKGHFATSHSHLNYYIDLTMTKHRLSEAREAAAILCSQFKSSTIIDTILCLDGTEVLGACLASELTRNGVANMNAHKTIYVVSPEYTARDILFRENMVPMIYGKHVLVLADTVITGNTSRAALEAIRYYGGKPVGVGTIFSCMDELTKGDYSCPVHAIFTKQHDLPDFQYVSSTDCPMCKQGRPLDAVVNAYGISSLR